jgi:hypothetical protein
MLKKLGIKVAAVLSISTLAMNALALQEWYLKPPGTGNWDWAYFTEINFAQTSDGTNAAGGKYLQLQGQLNSTNAHCLELETIPIGGTNPDTRIWVSDGSNVLSVNDDYNGTVQSKARFWMVNTSAVLDYVIQVAAYSSVHNSANFRLKVTRRDISEAACTTASGLPWAKMSGSGNFGTVTRGNWS